jgi:putative glutamine amidotransferase
MQVVNVALGGTLEQQWRSRTGICGTTSPRSSGRRRTLISRIARSPAITISASASSAGVAAVAFCRDGGVKRSNWMRPGRSSGVQWHPEDTAATDPRQATLLAGLVHGAR